MMEDIYLFHGKGGSPQGSVSVLQRALEPMLPPARYFRPHLLHHDPSLPAETALAALPELKIPSGAVVIGISLGGLVAARLQETLRPDLSVVCISTPTWADGVRLERSMPARAAFYSSNDEVILGRTAEWPSLATAFDVPSLSHDTDRHVELLARLIKAYLNKEDVRLLIP